MRALGPPGCLRCHAPLGAAALNQPNWVVCKVCGEKGSHWVFPARYRAEVRGQPAPQRTAEQASCFFHPEKAAEVACDTCGRFLCLVCDIQVGESHLCTTCFQAGTRPSSPTSLETERVLHDNITLMLSGLAPILFWPVAPLTAPYAIYRAIRYYNAPNSIVGRGKWRLYLAVLLALLQILGMVAIGYAVTKYS